MLTKYETSLFKLFSEMNGISGVEDELSQYLYKHFKSLNLPIVTDNLGSIFAYKASKVKNAKKVMIIGHMDEIGFIVTEIKENGMIKLSGVGGINPLTLTSQRLKLKTKQKTYILGAIDATPPHLLKGVSLGVPTVESLFADFGFTSKEEAVLQGVYLGAMVTFDAPFQVLNKGKRILGKAFDNRYSLVMILSLLKTLLDKELPYDLYLGATVQEEVGTRGAITSTYKIKPDFAIVLDCSPARDSSGDKNELGQLGGGLLLRYIDASMIARPTLLAYQEKMAKKAKVKTQYYQSPGGTDAGAVHKQQEGVMTLTHCIVARSIHSPSTILDSEDFLSSKKTLLAILKDLNSDRLNVLALKDHQ
jgi:glutamyl aminopeptidase